MRDENGVKLILLCKKHKRVKPFDKWQTATDEDLKGLEEQEKKGIEKGVGAVCDVCLKKDEH